MAGQRLCNACGKQNRQQARFCGYCGRSLRLPAPQKEIFALESLKKKTSLLKSLSLTIIVVALCGLFVYTNPTMDQYELFLRQKLLQEAQTDEERAVAALLGGFASWVVIQQTVRTDYIFFSIYDTNIENEHVIALGILNNFMLLEVPQSLRTRN
jgi:hypothetical protein